MFTAASKPVTLNGGDGNDIVEIHPGSANPITVFGNAGNDTVYSESAVGFFDTIPQLRLFDGGSGVDRQFGGDGDDSVNQYIDAEDATVNAENSSGSIQFTGSLAAGKHLFKTSNAGVTLTFNTSGAVDVTEDSSTQLTGTNTAGRLRRNEKRAAVDRSRPMASAAVIVVPEREAPGIKANAWPIPTANTSAPRPSSRCPTE